MKQSSIFWRLSLNHSFKSFSDALLQAGKTAINILKAVAKLSVTVIGYALEAFLKLWGGHRKLTEKEREEARKVFGWSINLDKVRVAVASIPADVLIFLNGNRPFTVMYVINFASWQKVRLGTLIHELTHVWQGVVAGPIYMVEALHSQMFGRGYRVTQRGFGRCRRRLRKARARAAGRSGREVLEKQI